MLTRIVNGMCAGIVLFLAERASAEESGPGLPGGLINPLEAKNIETLLLNILDILLTFALPIILFFIVYSGFKFVTAQGNATKVGEARSAFMWAVVGGVIILGANVLVGVIKETVEAL